MANNYNNDQLSDFSAINNKSYQGKLNPNLNLADNYLGKQKKTSGGDIGLSGKNSSKDIGVTGDSKGFSAGEQKAGKGYNPNNSTKGGSN